MAQCTNQSLNSHPLAATSGAAVNLLKSAAVGGSPLVLSPGGASGRFGCPLCDASVYSYCSNKAVHDGCCCSGGRPPVGYGYPCPPSRCNFLYANSCYEHQLIVSCCCNRP